MSLSLLLFKHIRLHGAAVNHFILTVFEAHAMVTFITTNLVTVHSAEAQLASLPTIYDAEPESCSRLRKNPDSLHRLSDRQMHREIQLKLV